jgi:CRP-like cAMP-binding protein
MSGTEMEIKIETSHAIDAHHSDHHNQIILDAFNKFGTSRTYKKNEFLFQENDPATAVYLVENGLVKISQSTQEGQGITLFLRYPGEVFGNAELLAHVNRRRYAKCLTASQIMSLESRQYHELAMQDAEFSYSLAVITARRLLQTQQRVESLISRPAAWRLGWFLYQIGKRRDGTLEVNLQLSHEEISYVIGCSRQTITETLNKWKENEMITYTKKKISILHPNRFFDDI